MLWLALRPWSFLHLVWWINNSTLSLAWYLWSLLIPSTRGIDIQGVSLACAIHQIHRESLRVIRIPYRSVGVAYDLSTVCSINSFPVKRQRPKVRFCTDLKPPIWTIQFKFVYSHVRSMYPCFDCGYYRSLLVHKCVNRMQQVIILVQLWFSHIFICWSCM
jgi:hypothetical protein